MTAIAVVLPAAPVAGQKPRRLAAATVLMFAVAVAAPLAGAAVRSTHGGHAAVDEPQYLLTALSLWEDHDLDISDELAERRWTAFHDTELPVQTAVAPDGRQLSPHDPLLPVLLAVPYGIGGWVGAKVTLALVAGLTAVTTLLLAVRRLAVPVPIATAGVGLAFASPPLAVYGQQVYPEMPAALAVLVAAGGLLGPLRGAGVAAVVAPVAALPWLGVKYAPVAGGLAVVLLVRLLRARRVRVVVGLAALWGVAGVAFLAAHRVLWGGWTAYAGGDHFATTGEFAVVGNDPDYVGRSLRLVALFADRGFGLVAWQPAWLLVVPALAALVRSRSRAAGALAPALLLGWLVATFLALTMHGFWWPGRQLVVVLPLAVLVVLGWVASRGSSVQRAALALGVLGLVSLAALVVAGLHGSLTWVTGFETVPDPLYQARRLVLPDYRRLDAAGWALHGAWSVVLGALAVLGWRSASHSPTKGSNVPCGTPETPAWPS